MKRRIFLLMLSTPLVCGMRLGAAQSSITPVEEEDRAENRVGRRFWARPAVNSTSVDFYAEPALRSRRPVYDKQRLRVLDIEAVDTARGKQIIYRVAFDDASEAYIDAADFDRRLYRELTPNQVMTAPADSAVGATPQIWTFQRSSLFAADPDVIWERIKNQGPRTFTPDRRKPRDAGKPPVRDDVKNKPPR